MQLSGIPFGVTDWSSIAPTEHLGQSGAAFWRTQTFGTVRVRMVEYTPGYAADHWCVNGHVLLCTEGELHTELKDGRRFVLSAGMSYQVADNAEPHRSSAPTGAKLFIVDSDGAISSAFQAVVPSRRFRQHAIWGTGRTPAGTRRATRACGLARLRADAS